MTDYMEFAKEVVTQAAASGAEAEAYISNQTETEILIDGGAVEQLSQSGSMGLGVRVIKDGRTGYAYTSDFSPESVSSTIESAIELAEIATPDEHRKLPEPQPINDEDLRIFDPAMESITTEEKVAFLKKVEQAALNYDTRVVMTNRCTYIDGITHVYLANSKGFAGSYGSTFAGSYLMAVARDENGMMSAMNLGLGTSFKELDAEAIGHGAGERAVSLLSGETVPTQTCTVVFDPFITAEIITYLSMALNAEALQRGRSFLANKLGQDVASDKVTLLDNGRLPGGLATAPFDGEGVPTSATRLIDEGIFQNVIYDSYTASRAGTVSTGNASRSSHRGLPSLSPSNFYLQPGPTAPEQIIAGVENGLYVTRIMQTGGIDPVTGDCSMGASGRWIENGKLTKAINGVTVATTLPDFLRNISEVGSDLRVLPFMGAVGAPTVRVENVTVGGAGS